MCTHCLWLLSNYIATYSKKEPSDKDTESAAKSTKMGWTGCARILLFVFNVIFWLSGAGILGVGIYILVSNEISQYIEVIHIQSAIPLFDYSAYILIAFGALVFVVGFCGCCGALRKSQCLLGFYIMFLVIVMMGELAAGILTVIYKDQIYSGMNKRIKDNLINRYGDSDNAWYTKSWDFVQVELKCCGSMSPEDFKTSSWKNSSLPEENVPMTCCVLTKPDPNDPKPVDNVNCQKQAYLRNRDKSVIHNQGCYTKLEEWFNKHTVIIIGVGFGIAGLEIFGLVFAVCMCREARRKDEVY